MSSAGVILWPKLLQTDRHLFAEFEIPGGLIEPSSLPAVGLPQEATRTDLGLILSGRGPVWLYAHLVHLAHIFAWVGVYDPRLRGAVVVQRHVPSAPALGSIEPIDVWST